MVAVEVGRACRCHEPMADTRRPVAVSRISTQSTDGMQSRIASREFLEAISRSRRHRLPHQLCPFLKAAIIWGR
ncbi:MAG TPA: hypothetical protein DDX19_07670 [Rhodopirellula baltica]|uniref:Uncharacterized protein n=1 Tax=Rhodopirellula baltica (strain DSM 10527 / NCIMB 13988 / SH1) TaxID=243090 RepID=Q7UQ39_RHOBA|nr:hypothetical protein RB6536 [Rhodopirellula baltica SH 1]HBE62610.1 hypothetical protein [Rhodopirellula baltica]